MAGPAVIVTQSPTGGALVISITLGNPTLNLYTTNITINRYTGSLSNPATIIYSGVYCPIYLDTGDLLPDFLDFGTPYYYSITDPTGTTTVGPIIPSSQISITNNYIDGILFRLFTAGVASLAIPAKYRKIRVLQQMPLTMASEATEFPYIVLNLDLEQQESLQIGEDVLASQTNTNILPLNIIKRYSINILSQSAQERDFYKDAVKSVAYTMMIALNQAGFGFTYDIQASNSQVGTDNLTPGFYISTIMLEFMGQFNMVVTTNYPPISSIVPAISGMNIVFQI